MPRRLFLSILGTGKYMPCCYRKDDMVLTETKFIQQALVEYLQKGKLWTKDDKVIVFLTPRAKATHWISTEQEQGLEGILSGMGVSYASKDIPDGKTTEEMWAIFEAIYSQLEEGDELYIDITHSFRYLPMLLIVLVNYAKLLKKVSVAGIYYGNWEAKDDNDGIAPIMDLSALSVLQDWTIAASDFQQYGQVKRLVQLADKSISNILRNPDQRNDNNKTLRRFVSTLQKVVDDRLTCRGIEIIDGSDAEKLRCAADSIETIAIAQFKPIFEQLKTTMSSFGVRNETYNCLKAAKWCLDNELYQQCITLLEEGVITILCEKLKLDYNNKEERELINRCVHIKTSEEEEVETESDVSSEVTAKTKEVLQDDVWNNRELMNAISNLGDVRNDYNHAGFRKNPTPAKTIKIRIEEIFNNICMRI